MTELPGRVKMADNVPRLHEPRRGLAEAHRAEAVKPLLDEGRDYNWLRLVERILAQRGLHNLLDQTISDQNLRYKIMNPTWRARCQVHALD